MGQQPTEEVRGGLEDDDITVQQPDIDAAVAAAVAEALEELRVAGRRPLNAGAQTVAFGKGRKASGKAERGGVAVAVSVSIKAPGSRKDDSAARERDEISYIDDTGQPKSTDEKTFKAEAKKGRVQGEGDDK